MKFQDGQIVKCEKCDQEAIVRTYKPDQIAIATKDALDGAALLCQDCECIVCASCAYSHNSMVSTCPKCNADSGPYFFPEQLSSDSCVNEKDADEGEKIKKISTPHCTTCGAEIKYKTNCHKCRKKNNKQYKIEMPVNVDTKIPEYCCCCLDNNNLTFEDASILMGQSYNQVSNEVTTTYLPIEIPYCRFCLNRMKKGESVLAFVALIFGIIGFFFFLDDDYSGEEVVVLFFVSALVGGIVAEYRGFYLARPGHVVNCKGLEVGGEGVILHSKSFADKWIEANPDISASKHSTKGKKRKRRRL